jgi:hypothetical protein
VLEQPLAAALDLSDPAGQILVVVFFLIPGLNCTWLIDRLAGRTGLSATERLMRAVSLSLFVYAAVSPWLVRVARRLPDGRLWTWEPILGAAFLIFVAPLLLALGLIWLRRWQPFRKGVRGISPIHPAPSAWDFAFAREPPSFVRAKLTDGQRVGGVFGSHSYASAYPEAAEVFLEEAWRFGPDGTPEEPVPGSRGILIRHDDVEWLDFLGIEVRDGRSQG